MIVYSNRECSALAAEALWLFAQRTGFAQEGELLETVLTDFMVSVMHLCQKTGLISEDYNCFPALLQAAEIHFEQEQNE